KLRPVLDRCPDVHPWRPFHGVETRPEVGVWRCWPKDREGALLHLCRRDSSLIGIADGPGVRKPRYPPIFAGVVGTTDPTRPCSSVHPRAWPARGDWGRTRMARISVAKNGERWRQSSLSR